MRGSQTATTTDPATVGPEDRLTMADTATELETLLAGLNEPQREAVTYGDGPLLILAGAGSGKTRVLTHRIAYLVATDRAKPNEILAITFTNKAAGEMRDRAELLVGRRVRAMWVMTFHAACARMLRAHADKLGYTRRFTIYDQADARRLIKRCLDELGIDPKRFTPAAIHNQISDAKNRLRDADAYGQMVGSYFEQTVADVYRVYQRELHRANSMDFDDLLVNAVNVLQLFQEVRDQYATGFRDVLVDEYQDTNHAQYRWLQLLSEERRNLMVVGDPDQCLVEGTLVTMADGTRKPIEQIVVGDLVRSCYGSGAFRPARVVRTHASDPMECIRITTAAGRVIESTPDHVHFAGYRRGHVPPMFITYLMRRRDKGCRVGMTRTMDRNGKSLAGLMARAMKEQAEEAWVITTHQSSTEARVAEAILSARYGLPTVPFVAYGNRERGGVMVSQESLDEIFASVDSDRGGLRLLHDEWLWPETPHHICQSYAFGRRNVVLTLCAEASGDRVYHTLSIGGRDPRLRKKLEDLGAKVADPRPGTPGWRSETSFRDVASAMALYRQIADIADVSLRCIARFGARQPGQVNSLPFMHASSVRPGMSMFTADGDYDIVERVERVPSSVCVYDIDIEGTHNFVANGLVTHNSIYAFRGAEIKNILNFDDDFPDAHIVRLEQNYRSTQTILDAANALITNNRGRMEKVLWTDLGQGDPIKVRELEDEHAEARFVTGEVQRLLDEGVSRAEIAIFYRTNAQSRVLQDTIVRADIPYQVIGGTKFYERAEIKDAIAYLTTLVNPQDAGAFTRIVNSPRRGIGSTSMSRLLAYTNTTGTSVWEAASEPDQVPGLGAPAVKAFRRFMATLHVLRERAETNPPIAALLKETLQETGYLEALEAERTIEAQGRIENLEELVNVAAEYDAAADNGGERSLFDFLQQVALISDADDRTDDQGLVTLMTLHNAKGLEYPIVFMIGCEEGVFPHSRALDEGGLEEERRLCYVGITRTQRDLYLTYARTRNVFGARSFGAPSRFISEIPAELTDQDRQQPRGLAGVREDVLHPKFGDGVVTGLEPGGIVVIHFSRDGSERKMVADLAPISRRG
jgi:ATP-dependent DNA helicase UvrD/PcrA